MSKEQHKKLSLIYLVSMEFLCHQNAPQLLISEKWMSLHFVSSYFEYVTWSDKTGLITHDRKSNFDTSTKLCKCTVRFQCQT